jgi:hypothetical protein
LSLFDAPTPWRGNNCFLPITHLRLFVFLYTFASLWIIPYINFRTIVRTCPVHYLLSSARRSPRWLVHLIFYSPWLVLKQRSAPYSCLSDSQINQIILASGIVILALFAFPRTLRFLLSDRRGEGWQLYHARDPMALVIQPNGLDFKSGAEYTRSPQTHPITSPTTQSLSMKGGRRDSADQLRTTLGSNTDIEKIYQKGYVARPAGQHHGQGAVGARWDWIGAKMSKFIGGPVKMLFGPWVCSARLLGVGCAG